MRYFLSLFLFFSSSVFTLYTLPSEASSQIAAVSAFRSYPKQIESVMQKLLQQPEFQELVATVRQKGQVEIVMSSAGDHHFEAFWDPGSRQVVLNMRKSRTLPSLVTSIVFELHNAKSEGEFDYWSHQACKRKISRARFVEEFERIEHRNALNTCSMLRAFVEREVFSPEVLFWQIDPSFSRHFAIQKQAGHSEFIGRQYDRMIGSGSIG